MHPTSSMNPRKIGIAVVMVAAVAAWMWWWMRADLSHSADTANPELVGDPSPTPKLRPMQVAAPVVKPVAAGAGSGRTTETVISTPTTAPGDLTAEVTANPQHDIATAIPYFLGLMKTGDINEQIKVFSWPGMTDEHFNDSLHRLAGPGGPKLIQAINAELELIRYHTPNYNAEEDTATWDFVNDGHTYHIVWFKYEGQWYFGSG